MNLHSSTRKLFTWSSGLAVLVCAVVAVPAATVDHPPGLYDLRTKARAGGTIGVAGSPAATLPDGDPLRRAWDRAASEHGGGWRVWLDERSGLPTLATVRGVDWSAAIRPASTGDSELDRLAELAERFRQIHATLIGRPSVRLALDREASGRRGVDVWHIRFAQSVDGVPVEGAFLDFDVSHGRLVSFGARHVAPVHVSAIPSLTIVEARTRLDDYVRPAAEDGIRDLADPELVLIPLAAGAPSDKRWQGRRGEGYAHRLIWRFRFTDSAGIATWTGEVDAHTGEIVAFYDATHYDRIKGNVNPISDDGQCAIGGCPEPDFPMPFVDYSENGGALQFANQFGLYQCATLGSTIETTLGGQYVVIADQCGPISATTICDNELDLGVADDINCGVAVGESAGNTDAARSAYYSLSVVNRKARFWVPGNTWLEGQIECATNVDSTCNAAYGSGLIVMYRAGNGCGNTAQIQGIVTHEWGHGFDDNDGGGFDNPSEAYSDIVAIFEARESCVGRGFSTSENCSGYGDTCLDCTGLREMDWDARQAHAPATPAGFLDIFCPNGGGPCGKEVHCESHLASEAMFDLATRDLPATGIDADSAWQLAERLWYQSRPGSGGDAYNCTIPSSDSCSAGSWYHQLRLQDDDDGDLSNGTPHAAAIFAAFDRHDIACGAASDPENQDSSSCPSLAAPVLNFTAQSNAVVVDWSPIPGASSYRLYRNEIGCDRGQFPIVELDGATTNYLDDGLANDFPVFYRVQAIGANAACESPVSSCVEASAQQLAGRVRFDRVAYNCSAEIVLEVTDLNHPTTSMTVTIGSDSESTPESVLLTETSGGSAKFSGRIFATSAPAAADGLISIADGDTITAEYVDLDDGGGGVNVVRQSVAFADCRAPLHPSVQVLDITDDGATIAWTTSEPTTGTLEWGSSSALGNVVTSPLPSTSHSVVIGPLSPCDRFYFRVTSLDAVGNVAIADAQGAPFEFNAGMVQGIFHQDNFETDTGWTLEGDWEIGPPLGLGTAPGDPTAASEGLQVLGQDLSGQGSNPGDYEFNTTRSAISPVIDASSQTNVELRLDRWLNYQESGTASILAKDINGIWQTVFASTGGLTEVAWSERTYDASAFAAGNPTLQIRFQQVARFGIDAGWNVDRLVLRDGSVPTFGACGGCTGAPTFAGVASAIDDDPCLDSGVTVSWAEAPAWGSGNGGTYAVYRDSASGFTPSPANLVASGIAGTSWVDPAPPVDVESYYLVRAENDESCGGGPNNNGLIDANQLYAGATNSTGQAVPGGVGDTLRADRANASDVRLSWTPVPDATEYRAHRSATPDVGFVVVGQSTGSMFDDPGALADGQSWYYLLTALNACGGESGN